MSRRRPTIPSLPLLLPLRVGWPKVRGRTPVGGAEGAPWAVKEGACPASTRWQLLLATGSELNCFAPQGARGQATCRVVMVQRCQGAKKLPP